MKAYFASLIAVLLLALAGYGVLMTYVANRGSFPVEAEYWVGEELALKQWLADRAGTGRRVLILSGSNSLFGIDSGLIERRMGFATVNLSTHGGLPLSFQLDYADKIVRAGDVVILPLEYEYYQRPLDQFAEGSWQMALAMFPEVFRRLPMIRRLSLLMQMEPRMLLDGAYVSVRRLVQPDFMQQRSPPDLQSVILKWKNAAHARPAQYGVEATDEHGDFKRFCGNANADWTYSIAGDSFRIRPDVEGALKRQADQWKKRGARVYISFPPVSTDVRATPLFDENATKLGNSLERTGIETLGRPSDYVFPRAAFYDRRYHLNCEGRVSRTLILLRQLGITENLTDRQNYDKSCKGVLDATKCGLSISCFP